MPALIGTAVGCPKRGVTVIFLCVSIGCKTLTYVTRLDKPSFIETFVGRVASFASVMAGAMRVADETEVVPRIELATIASATTAPKSVVIAGL